MICRRVGTDSAGDNGAMLAGEPVWQTAGGKLGGALRLDGVDDYVETPFILNPAAGPFSVLAWVKGGVPGQVVLSQTQANGANWLMAGTPEGALRTEFKGTGRGSKPLASATVITDGAWHRVRLVWDGSKRTLYVDGVEVAGDTQISPPGSLGGLYLGAGSTLAPGTFWSGLIDDVRI